MTNKKLRENEIPEAIREAVVVMLRPYAPRVEEWLERLVFEPEVQERADNYLTRLDLSRRLRLSLPTIDRLISSNEIESLKIRRSVRVSEKALHAYLKNKRV